MRKKKHSMIKLVIYLENDDKMSVGPHLGCKIRDKMSARPHVGRKIRDNECLIIY